jgi:hypothetical protein
LGIRASDRVDPKPIAAGQKTTETGPDGVAEEALHISPEGDPERADGRNADEYPSPYGHPFGRLTGWGFNWH